LSFLSELFWSFSKSFELCFFDTCPLQVVR
jgi:hypothetical protein